VPPPLKPSRHFSFIPANGLKLLWTPCGRRENGADSARQNPCYCLLYTPHVLCHADAMQKDFPGWHRQKERLHAQHHTPTFQEREIWWCSVGVNVGHEMDGKNQFYNRPVLMVAPH
jgi:hypothetical protein